MSIQEKNNFIILGSGTSTGIPIITCTCDICLSSNPKNKRTRMSALIQTKSQKNILIDSSPDMRQQLLRHQIRHLDAVVITHAHADHIHGLDDLRAFTYNREQPLKVYTNKQTAQLLRLRFAYIFDQSTEILGGAVAKLELYEVESGQEVIIENEPFYFYEVPHGNMGTLSFIHHKLAYLTDANSIPTPYLKKLISHELEHFFIDCAALKPHRTHMHFQKSLEYVQQVKAGNSYLIHMSHEFEHESFTNQLKCHSTQDKQYFVSYDGLTISY